MNNDNDSDIERLFCVHFSVHNEQSLGEFRKLNFEMMELEFQGWQKKKNAYKQKHKRTRSLCVYMSYQCIH